MWWAASIRVLARRLGEFMGSISAYGYWFPALLATVSPPPRFCSRSISYFVPLFGEV